MRFDELRSIAHNIADSLASGYSWLIGMYDLNVFGEAANSPERLLEIDFLAGTVTGGPISPALREAVVRLREALPGLCEKHGVSLTAFRQLRARFSGSSYTFIVTTEDARGYLASDTYTGIPGARPRTLDHLGRIRTTRPSSQRVSR